MNTNTAQTESTIRNFMAENFIIETDSSVLNADTSLTQSGVVDSMGVLELIMFIEQEYGITIPDEDTLPENLDSVSRIVSYVSRRLEARPGA
jgi:acyl carrier protein